MGSFSIWHWLVVLAVVLLLFGGGGKISKILGDMGRGIKNFKKGLKEGDEGADSGVPPQAPQSQIGGQPVGTDIHKEDTVKR
ncbi:MAG: twin-arginine translocase TatA/TatE family subunit [Alphaproteobacteria bacterium]